MTKAIVEMYKFHSDKENNTASVTLLVTYNETDILLPLPVLPRPTSPEEWRLLSKVALDRFLEALRVAQIEALPEPR